MSAKKKKELKPSDFPIEVFDEYLIVRREVQTETAGGIALPESEKREKVGVVGVVLAAGKGRFLDNGQRQEMPVKPGDRVLMSGLAGLDLGEDTRIEMGLSADVDVKNIFLVRQMDIIGKLTN